MNKAWGPEQLREYQALCREIESLERRRADKLDRASRASARYRSDRVKGGERRDAEIVIAEAAEIGREITTELLLRRSQAVAIEKHINGVQDSRMRQVLRLRYLTHPPMTWEQIGRVMGYSGERVRTLHREHFRREGCNVK